MEPGVPFALLGAVQLLAVAACGALFAAALLRGRGLPQLLVGAGALVLAGVEVRTALDFGSTGSDLLVALRALGGVLLAAGLVGEAFGRARTKQLPLPGVVVPLAAGLPASFTAAVATALAALACLRGRRDLIGALLGSGLLLWAAAAYVAHTADSGTTSPTTVLALRGGGALLVLAGTGVLGRSSLAAKVVGAIIAGVLVMAIAAVGVVGTVVVSTYEQQSESLVSQAAEARGQALNAVGNQAAGVVFFAERGDFCADEQRCLAFLSFANSSAKDDFVVRVDASGQATSVAGRPTRLSPSEAASLSGSVVVKQVLASGQQGQKLTTAPVSTAVLTGARVTVAEVAVFPHTNAGTGKIDYALVYGQRLSQAYTANDFSTGGYGLTVVALDPARVTASNIATGQRAPITALTDRSLRDGGAPTRPRTLGSEGSDPILTLFPLLDTTPKPVALLVVSRKVGDALGPQQRALRLLLETAFVTVLVVAAFALLLGRRTVEPVRQLTAAARRVAAGEVVTQTDRGGRDEVGVLARTFDLMTASLAEASEELRASALRLGTVLSSMSDGLLATDGAGLVTSVNPAALTMLGLSETEVLGAHLEQVADVRDEAGRQYADISLRVGDAVAQVHRADGSTVPVRVAITPLEGADGVVLVLRDTTREREVERMKTEFLSNVSHELRTPLTPIRGYAEILVSRPGLDSDKVTQFATTIRDESLKMNRVVDLLVDVAALEAGRVHVMPRPVSARALLSSRLEAWQAKAGERRSDLGLKVSSKLPAVDVDPSWVGKALDEFIDNALKYSPVGTPVTLFATLAPSGHVRVGVRDKGPGISEADQATLFTSFEQVDGSATRRVGGLGLGLSFVNRVAEDSEFPLGVTSTVGKGSEFTLDLPSTDQPIVRQPVFGRRPLRR